MNAEIPTLRVRSVVKRYGSVSALRGVDLDVRAGEIVALVGDNGAGKSTLVKIIAGATPLTEGTIEFEGQPVTLSNPKASADLGIATIYQDLALCDNLDVVSNLFLGRELGPGLGRGARLLDTATMENRARTLLERFNVRLANLRAPVAALSGGQRQSVAIARSLIGDPQVVLLDEPTAALGVAQTAQVLDFVSRLADEGHAVVLISHNLADVFAVCHRISVLHQGRNAGDFEVGSVTQDDVVAAITGSAQVGAGRRPGLPSTSALRQKGPTE